jgi:folate-dependent phosphoribosylglycinamide formyltransferase PurN
MLKPLYNPAEGQMRIVGLMGRDGSNLERIMQEEHRLKNELGQSPFSVVAIYCAYDSSETFNKFKAAQIGKTFGVDVVHGDINEFYKDHRKIGIKDMDVRAEFDHKAVEALRKYAASVAAYCDYRLIATDELVNAYIGVNSHQSDLRIRDEITGLRKYTGNHTIRDALYAGESQLRSSIQLVDLPNLSRLESIDCGRLLMISDPVKNITPADIEQIKAHGPGNENEGTRNVIRLYSYLLKMIGEWPTFPLALRLMAEGRYAADETGLLYFDGKPIPQGLLWDDFIK